MSTFETDYVYFYTKNHTGSFATTGYALPITPFKFLPVVVDTQRVVSNKRIVWDFGDGTRSTDVSASHTYLFPGQYNVTLYLYESGGDSFFDSFSQTITVKNWVADTITLSDVISGSSHNHQPEASHIEKAFKVTRHNSWQTYNAVSADGGYTLHLYASGTNAPLLNFKEYVVSPYDHLKPSARFYINERNGFTGETEFVIVSSVVTTNDEIYVKLNDSSQVVTTVPSDSAATFAGTSGIREVFYVDDFPTTSGGSSAVVSVAFDLKHFDDPASYNKGIFKYVKRPPISWLNQVPRTLEYTFTTQASSHKLVFSSNGIDGDGSALNTFNINVNQFEESRIPFVVRVKDFFEFPTKYVGQLSAVPLTADLSLNTVHIEMLTGTGHVPEYYYDLQIDNQSLSSTLSGGFFKGYIIPHFNTTADVTLSATAYIDLNFYGLSSLSAEVVSGSSNAFNIWSDQGKYSIAKQNENVDYQKKFKQHRFQEPLLDDDFFFDDFLGTIVGALTSNPNTLGKKTHEKIANFVANNRDPDICNLNALFSLAEEVGLDLNEFDRNKFTSPPNFARILDLLSIKQSLLWGERNQFVENFDDQGVCGSTVVGFNLGNKLPVATTVLTAGDTAVPIVAYENFSQTYRLLNTDLLSSAYVSYRNVTNQSYELSAYDVHWGWGLTLPSGVSGTDIESYYTFYEFVDIKDNTQLEGVINWSDNLTTLNESASTRNEWIGTGQIVDNLLTYELFKGLRLFTSASDIEY